MHKVQAFAAITSSQSIGRVDTSKNGTLIQRTSIRPSRRTLSNQKQRVQLKIKGEEEAGIGVQIQNKGGDIHIIPLFSSPAMKAGLTVGDVLLTVNGESVQGLKEEDVAYRLRGPKGSQLTLGILREGKSIAIQLTRNNVVPPEILLTDHKYEDRVPCIKITSLGIFAGDIRSMLDDIVSTNPKGIVLDLRNNPGGLFDSVESVISSFLPQETIFAQVVDETGTHERKTEHSPQVPEEIGMAILVNQGTANGAEIIASALREADRAILIGEHTYGRGILENYTQFPSGKIERKVIGELRTSQGKPFQDIGLEPDIKISAGNGEGDPQLDQAVRFLLSARRKRRQ